MEHDNTSDTKHALASCLEHFQQRAATTLKDREKEALIALTRALDCTAASIHWNKAIDGAPAEMAQGLRRAMFFLGSAPAMRPLLLAVKDQGGGVPLGPSHTDAACFAYSYLDACGMPRMHGELGYDGETASRNRVARLMARHGLFGVPQRRPFRSKRTGVRPDRVRNHLERDFVALEPNTKWVTDITRIHTGEG